MNSVELFAGSGGLALGAARAGFLHRAVLDWSDSATATLLENRGRGVAYVRDWPIQRTDLSTFDFRHLREAVDYVFGGPPCQPFSVGGKHLGDVDERNLFPVAIRAVGEIQPRAFILENVRGLLRDGFASYSSYVQLHLRFPTLTRREGEDWTDHLARLREVHESRNQPDLRYDVSAGLLNAANFGVPQHRWRVFIVGTRCDSGIQFTLPEATHHEDALLYDQWVSGAYWERHRVPMRRRRRLPEEIRPRVERLTGTMRDLLGLPWNTVRDAIADLPRVGVGRESRRVENHFLNPGARSYPGHTGSEYDLPAKTLKAGAHGVPGGENMLRRPDGTVRYFSVRECARLQTVPDEWVFLGSWCACMRLLGNAVPVRLAQAVSSSLAAAVREAELQRRRQPGDQPDIAVACPTY